MSHQLSVATTVPKTPVRSQNGWDRIDVTYHGYPVYVNRNDGAMAYEQDFERLVSVPEEAEEAIVTILFGDWQISQASPEVRDAIAARAN